MKTVYAIIAVVMVIGMASCEDEIPPPSCDLQEEYCRKYCADGGGEEGACKTKCGIDLEACKCSQDKKCNSEECVNGCYENSKDGYDCNVNHQTCLGFCKNQFAGDENCVSGHCKFQNERCECLKAGNCPTGESATPGPIPMPSCKFLHGKCLKDCRAGEGEDAECNTLCQADSEICACTRKNMCGNLGGNEEEFDKCIRRCQSSQKDNFNCDTFQKTCLGNCKTNFEGVATCPQYCTKSVEECKCVISGECPS